MPVSIRPLGDRVLVEPVESEETFAGGAFVLPETAKEKPQQGLIRAAGPGQYDEEGEQRLRMEVQEGDRVLFAKYAGTEVTLDGVSMLIMKESDILGIVEA